MNAKEFWTYSFLLLVATHLVIAGINILAGWSLSETYNKGLLIEVLFPNINPQVLWLDSSVWLIAIVLMTLLFVKRLKDISLPRILVICLPLTMIWLVFVGFWDSSNILVDQAMETNFWWSIFVFYAAGIFTLVASILPSKQKK